MTAAMTAAMNAALTAALTTIQSLSLGALRAAR